MPATSYLYVTPMLSNREPNVTSMLSGYEQRCRKAGFSLMTGSQ